MDEGLLTAAQAVMSVADEPGWRAGKYTIEVNSGQGAHVEDDAEHNTF